MNVNLHHLIAARKRRYPKRIPLLEADFGFVRYSLRIGSHQNHRKRYGYGCYDELAILTKEIGGKRQELVEFHSYHLARYFWRILNGKAANYPLYLLRGASLHTVTGCRDVYTLALASKEYTNGKFNDLEHVHRVKVEVIPVPEGFPGHGREVILAGFQKDFGYFLGPAVAIAVEDPQRETALQKSLAEFLAATASGLAKALALQNEAARVLREMRRGQERL
jgi:hypothetical protein